jgi:hypothetical protein
MIKSSLPKLDNNFNRNLRQVMGSNDRVPVFILTTVGKNFSRFRRFQDTIRSGAPIMLPGGSFYVPTLCLQRQS